MAKLGAAFRKKRRKNERRIRRQAKYEFFICGSALGAHSGIYRHISHFLAGTSAHTRGRSHSYKHDRDAALFQMKEKPELVFSKGRKSSPGYI